MTGADRPARVAAHFRLPGPVTAVTPAPGGLIHASWRIDCGDRAFLLQRVNTAVFPDPDALARNLVRITNHLRQAMDRDRNRYPAMRLAAPWPTSTGAFLHRETDGSVWRFFLFLTGTVTREAPESLRDAELAGQAYGAFHRLTADLDPDTLTVVVPGFHNTAVRLRQLELTADSAAPERLARCQNELAFLGDRAPLATALDRLGAPQRVAHNDAKLANVLLAASGETWIAVVDLDTVMPGTWLHDFGDLVRTVTCRAAEDAADPAAVAVEPELWEGLVRGYLAEAGELLTAPERDGLLLSGQVITYEQALRFLTDHLAGDVYYRTSRPDQNLDRARTQILLLRHLVERENDLAAIVRRF